MILWLEEIDRSAVEQAGGKGANLGETVRAGLPVPPGFVVTADAYWAHLAAAGLQGGAGDLPLLIEESPMPAAVAEAITAAYARLAGMLPRAGSGQVPVAVRSSATAEDLPDASFAGQQETYLNVVGAEQLLTAVKRCWASLWAPRAVDYRGRVGYGGAAVSLAAVVQAMVPAETAGVMFTANPVTGARDEYMVTASYGLGEAVVSGLVTPDTFVLGSDGSIRQKSLGTKEVQVVPAGAGDGVGAAAGNGGEAGETTRTELVAAAERARFCLSDSDLAALADLGRRVTAHYGQPMDTEWAFAGGRLYLLQARPITALAEVFDPNPVAAAGIGNPIMLHNILDHFPDPPRPLDFAIMRVALGGIFALLRQFGLRPGSTRDLACPRPDGRVAVRIAKPKPTPALLWRLPATLVRALGQDPAVGWAAVRERWSRALGTVETSGSPEQLLAQFQKLYQVAEEFLPDRFSSIFLPGLLHVALLRFWVSRAVGKAAADEVVRQLYLALPYRTAQMNLEIARLARVAADEGRESPAFGAALTAFLNVWGSRSSRGMVPMPSSPTWREEPAPVLGLVDALVQDPQALDAGGQERRQAEAFAAARERVLRRPGWPWRSWFATSLARARSYLVAREDSLDLFEQWNAATRQVILALGRQMVARGLWRAEDDGFYLLETELPQAVRGELPDVKTLVSLRRKGYAYVEVSCARGQNWLEATGSLPAGPAPADRPRAAAGRLSGSAASGGLATGKVCIVRSPAEFGKLEKGDVLVAPFTAPAWTPLFSLAAAVVTETGGPLSHAAIVAREYGIPAVLAVPGAVNALKDGQRVTVDGNTGRVLTG